MDRCKNIDQHVIKMAALGRQFQLGDLYNYRNDHILKEGRLSWESADLPSGTRIETGFNMKLLCPDSDITQKWQHMGLDGHLQASILAGLFETEAEADKLIGASHYVKEKVNPNEVTRTFIFRAMNRKEHLDLPNYLKNNAVIDGQLPDATHIVVGIAYGAEAYCVLAQNVKGDNEDDREEMAEFLTGVSSSMKTALEEKQHETEFKEQFTKEEKKLFEKIKCRFYADHQVQPVRKCNLFDAYNKLYRKFVDQVMTSNTEEAVPVVAVVLCPLRNIVRANARLEKMFEYRDVDAGLVARCCRICTELDQVISTSESLRLSFKKTSCSCPALRQFTNAVSKFKELLKNSWKKSIVKARESEDKDDQEVEMVAHIAETHPLFNISRLNQWLRFKKAEIEMVEKLEKIDGITFLADKTQLEKKLVYSFEKRHAIVLNIPPLDQSTKDLLCAMKNYVDKNTELVAADDDSEDVLPWHLVKSRRKQVRDKIHKMSDYIIFNDEYYEKHVQFFILPSEEGDKKLLCSYSVYEADNLLKDNLTQLPSSISFNDETDIGRSKFSDTGSKLKVNQSINVAEEESSIKNEKETILQPPILVVSDVTQTTADLVWTPSTLAAENAAFSHKIRYWRNGQRSSFHVCASVCVDSGENQFRLEDLQPGSTYSINIVATSEDGHNSAPSAPIEFTTHQLQEVSTSVGISQNSTFSTVVDELKQLRELVTNLTKESDATKSALMETCNQLTEKIKESTECWTKHSEETQNTLLALNKKLNGMTSDIVRRVLQDEVNTAIEKKWFETIKSTSPNVKTIEDLILRGVDVNTKDINEQNALHFLCQKNNNENLVDLVRLLVKYKVDVNAKDNHGQTALHLLCRYNQDKNVIDVVRLLVENGVDVNAKDDRGLPALRFLCIYNRNENLIDIVRLFVENGAVVNAKDDYGEAPRDLIRKYYNKANAKDILKLLGE